MTLDIYSHVMPSMHEDAMNKLNEAVGKSSLGKDEPEDEQATS